MTRAPRQRYSLLLPSGKLFGHPIAKTVHPHHVESAASLWTPSPRLARSAHIRPESDIARRGEMREEAHRTGTPCRYSGLRAGMPVIRVRRADRFRHRQLKSGDHPKRRRLAAARRTEQTEHLPFV